MGEKYVQECGPGSGSIKLFLLGGFQPPRPPGGGLAAPRAPLHTERLRLSGSPFFLGTKIIGFPGPKSQKIRISSSPDLQISKIPDFQVPRFPDAAGGGGCGCGRILRSQPDPSPNAPRDQIRRKGPCCDKDLSNPLACLLLLKCGKA